VRGILAIRPKFKTSKIGLGYGFPSKSGLGYYKCAYGLGH